MLWTGSLHTFHSAEKRTVSYYHEVVADRRRGPGTEEGMEKGSGGQGTGEGTDQEEDGDRGERRDRGKGGDQGM